MSEIKKINVGKTVKKWIGQGKNIAEVSTILHSMGHKYSIQDCIDAYYDYMGWRRVISERSGAGFIKAVLNREKIHVYGSTGVGKTFTVKSVAKELDLDMIVSYARLTDDLVADWGTTPYEEDDKLFVLEGDAFYWKAYGVIKNYIINSKSTVVIITTGKDTPTKNITKLVKQIKIFPPSKDEMQHYILQFDPNWKGDIDKIYDRDQRITWRNYLYNKNERTAPYEGITQAKDIAYKILKGTATIEDFEKSVHPWYFVLGWISYNAVNFYNDDKLKKALHALAWIDTHKFNYKQRYLVQMLLELPKADMKGFMSFPPYKSKPKTETTVTQKVDYVIEKYKLKTKPKPKKKKGKQKKVIESVQESVEDDEFWDDLGDFMAI